MWGGDWNLCSILFLWLEGRNKLVSCGDDPVRKIFALKAQGMSFIPRTHIKSQVYAYILSTGAAETG